MNIILKTNRAQIFPIEKTCVSVVAKINDPFPVFRQTVMVVCYGLRSGDNRVVF